MNSKLIIKNKQGSAVYINENYIGGEFLKQGIELKYHQYKHPKYSQGNVDFIPYLGVFDIIFNLGFETAIKVIRSGRLENFSYNKYV
tara:strand:+ start:190 stop:450 length:261 start_codon:yes stop_codon:yes gene_type:complete